MTLKLSFADYVHWNISLGHFDYKINEKNLMATSQTFE